jgi:dihydrofolate reductase
MKLTTVTNVSVDGVMQGLGGSDEDRRGGFERGGWALPLFNNDDEATAFVNQVYERADAFLFGRRTYEIFAASWGTWADPGDSLIWTALNTQRSATRNGRTRPSSPVTWRRPSAS